MPRQAQSCKPFGGLGRRLRAEEEGRQGQQPVGVGGGGGAGGGAAGLGRDVGQVLPAAGDGTAGEVEAVAELGQQLRFPAHVVRQQGFGALAPEAGDEGDETVEGAGVRLAVRQRALDHGAGGGQEGGGGRVLPGQGGGG